ncbi:MAG TPA: enoyl-CoA hydratase/isomerase family protein [Syntrophomonas sp.]|nr:enoyl-CoA hydratase/isomerase family protein [Syntrophomonas sp.]
MSYEYQIVDNIVIFQFNRGKLNSITMETLQGLNEVIDRVNQENELKGIILTGQGRYFSGGFDLGTFTSFQSKEEILDWFNYEEEVLFKLFTCSKPVVAAINGHATAMGMILSMACDYRLVINNPKIKLGMTEIKIGLSLTLVQGTVMRFGLDTDKKYRDVIYKGELFAPEYAVAQGIFDELAENEEELLEKAKAKVVSMIDTPGRPFIILKELEKMQTVDWLKGKLKEVDWGPLVTTFTDEKVVNTLKMVKAALGE